MKRNLEGFLINFWQKNLKILLKIKNFLIFFARICTSRRKQIFLTLEDFFASLSRRTEKEVKKSSCDDENFPFCSLFQWKKEISSSQDGGGREDDGRWVVDAERKQFSEWRNEDFYYYYVCACFVFCCEENYFDDAGGD